MKILKQSVVICQRYFASQSKALKKTVLHDFHVQHGAKMVEFAGYSMPVQYSSQSIVESHHHVRKACGIFDVSHMLQVHVEGRDCVPFFESLSVADVQGLSNGSGTLSLYTNPAGGIMDDLIVTKVHNEHLYVVSNAGCADKILPHLLSKAKEFCASGGEVKVHVLDHALVAVQGPLVKHLLQRALSVNLSELGFMHSTQCSVFGIANCRVTRCGYTGEDGVEISVPADQAQHLCETLLSLEGTRMIGLAARDSLRLEAGLCLYGNDIDESTSPAEAALLWTIGKARRLETAPTKFPGWEHIIGQIKNKALIQRRRVAFIAKPGPVARHGAKIVDENNAEIGEVTSGMFSPILNANIGMAYVPDKFSKIGQTLHLSVRNKIQPAKITKMPFVPTNYFQNA